MNTLKVLSWLLTLVAFPAAMEESEFSQLDMYENPKTFVFDGSEFEPIKDFVVLYASKPEELATALKNPEKVLKNFPTNQTKYALVVDAPKLKSATELRALAKKGTLPIMHWGYQITKNIRAPILFLPVGLVEVELNSVRDTELLKKLAEELDLELVEESQTRSGTRSSVSSTRKTLELAGKSKYRFVFDVAAEVAKADFIKFARPIAPILTRDPTE